MWVVTAILLALLCLVLLWRNFSLRRMLHELADCASARQPLLLERRGVVRANRSIERLQDTLNTLIAEARQGHEKDRDYLQQIEATLGNIREAVLIVDDGNYVRMANDAVRQLIGPEKVLLGRRLESLIQSAGFLAYVRSVRDGAKLANEVVELQREGISSWFEVNGTVLPETKDSPRLALFVLHDITQLKALERMRTDFVANVSHELRTPVTIIRGFTDTLLDGNDDLTVEERERFLLKIQRNVTRLHDLLEDLLTISRMESRAETMQRERIPLNQLVAEVCENFRGRLSQEIALETDLDPRDAPVEIDTLRMGQVIDNLLDNAVRHARGMQRMVVRTRRVGDGVRCIVEDDGCGIPGRDLPHIFERFYRVDKGRSRELGGTGLGLSIVKHIVMQHGGTVFAESEPGRGARIGFTLPLAGIRAGGIEEALSDKPAGQQPT